MTRANEYRAYFTLVGEFDPIEITSRLGLTPTRCWKKGDLNPRTQFERKFSRWCLDSRLDQSRLLEEQLADVLEQLQPLASLISQLQPEFEAGMQLVGYFNTSYPGFGLDSASIAGLTKLGLGIDCDFYYLYSDEREDS